MNLLKSTIAVTIFLFANFLSGQINEDSLQYTGAEILFVGKKIHKSDIVSLSNRDFKKLAASFDDPTRLLIRFPGFSASTDQANGIIYHGMPSNLFSWQINGLDVVNPNHLSNAGTASDLGSPSSGGVNMLSGNVINQYHFRNCFSTKMTAPSIGGVSNMIVDSIANNYIQFSLLGLETGLIKKWKRIQFYANYRYSFTGLLDKLGVKFGNEAISFHDLVIGSHTTRTNSLTSFLLILGESKNIHNALDSFASSVKDPIQINYESAALIFQGKHQKFYDKNKSLNLAFSYSTRFDDRSENGLVYFDSIHNYQTNKIYKNDQKKITLLQEYTVGNAIFGLKEIVTRESITNTNLTSKTNFQFIPYFLYKIALKKNLFLNSKIAFSIFKNIIASTPALNLQYVKNKNNLTFSSSLTNQNLHPSNLLNNTLLFAHSVTPLSFNNMIEYKYNTSNLDLGINLFHHYFFNLPSITPIYYNGLSASALNSSITNFAYRALANATGTTIFMEYLAPSNLWLNGNLTFFEIKGRAGKFEEKFNLETNYRYTANASIGRDIVVKKNNKLSITASAQWRGKSYLYAIQPYTLGPENRFDLPPMTLLQPYFRLDMRINYTMKKSLISLDIQNVTNKFNYNFVTNEKEGLTAAGALGLLPVLTFKKWWK